MNELPFGQKANEHLLFLTEHEFAPKYNFQSSDLLDQARLESVKNFAFEIRDTRFWEPGELPAWMPEYLRRVFRQVPYYREFGDPPRDFEAIPTISRTELGSEISRLVPDDVKLEDLTVYTTSGTTGTRLVIPTDAAVASKVLVLMERLLEMFGERLDRGPGKVSVASLYFQAETLHYPSLSHYLEGAATLKLNLHPDAWHKPEHRAAFLLEQAPGVVSGCPYSLNALLELAPELRPRGLFSSAEALSQDLKTRLEDTFECPLFDVYGMTEAKYIAARHQGPDHDLLSPDLYVEVLDQAGRRVAPGEMGEITLTCGRNRCLPLLRYRTGDYARLGFRGSQPYLRDFQGREPIVLFDGSGETISTQDVVHNLKELPLVGFAFHQQADRSYALEFSGDVEPAEIERLLRERLGLQGQIQRVPEWNGKHHRFTTS